MFWKLRRKHLCNVLFQKLLRKIRWLCSFYWYGLKFGTWVHLGMAMNLHIGCYKSCWGKNGDFAICSELGFFFAKEVPKVHCKTLKTIGAHKVNHISTPNQLLVECESSLPSPHDIGKSALTKVWPEQVEIQKKSKKCETLAHFLCFTPTTHSD